MKKFHFIYIISVCFACFFTSCEKTSNQTTTQSIIHDAQLTTRDDLDCEGCGVGCCCCAVELTGASGGTLSFCGLCSGDYLCGTYNPGSPCSSFSGVGKNINLSIGHPRAIFCVPEGGSFRIYNGSGNDIDIRFTCQGDLVDPQFVTITIHDTEELFFYSDGECFLEGC